MREIVFRGKRADNGNWIQGSLFTRVNDDVYIIPLPIITSKSKVDTGTVGQFTGLTDKNGNKIFEGDILRFMAYGCDYTGKVEFLNGAFWIKCKFLDRIGAIVHQYKPEIIGNIHDNPELLTGTKVL